MFTMAASLQVRDLPVSGSMNADGKLVWVLRKADKQRGCQKEEDFNREGRRLSALKYSPE